MDIPKQAVIQPSTPTILPFSRDLPLERERLTAAEAYRGLKARGGIGWSSCRRLGTLYFHLMAFSLAYSGGSGFKQYLVCSGEMKKLLGKAETLLVFIRLCESMGK